MVLSVVYLKHRQTTWAVFKLSTRNMFEVNTQSDTSDQKYFHVINDMMQGSFKSKALDLTLSYLQIIWLYVWYSSQTTEHLLLSFIFTGFMLQLAGLIGLFEEIRAPVFVLGPINSHLTNCCWDLLHAETSRTVNSLQCEAEWLAFHLDADAGREVNPRTLLTQLSDHVLLELDIKLVI